MRSFARYTIYGAISSVLITGGFYVNADSEPSDPEAFWHKATQANDREAVLATVQQMYSALSKRQWDEFKQLFVEGGTIAAVRRNKVAETVSAEVRLSSEWIDHYSPMFEQKSSFTERSLHAQVNTYGTVAQVWSHFHATYTDDEHAEPGTFTGIDAITLLKIDGHWRIYSIAYAGAE